MRWQPLLFVLFGACGGGGDVTIDIAHDVCTPIVITSATPTAVQTVGIDAALALWRDHGVPSIDWMNPATLSVGAPIEIRFEAAALAYHGLYDDETGVIYINAAITDPHALEVVIAHELGHAFGLPHVNDRPSLMNKGNTRIAPTDEDVTALAALWGTCAEPTSSAARPGS